MKGICGVDEQLLRSLIGKYVKACGGDPRKRGPSAANAFQMLFSGISEMIRDARRDTRTQILDGIYRAIAKAADGDE